MVTVSMTQYVADLVTGPYLRTVFFITALVTVGAIVWSYFYDDIPELYLSETDKKNCLDVQGEQIVSKSCSVEIPEMGLSKSQS
jgi:hypothetical protein